MRHRARRCDGAGMEPAQVIGGRAECPVCGRMSAVTMGGRVNWHSPAIDTGGELRCRRCQRPTRMLFDRPDGRRGQVCGHCYDALSDDMVGITSSRDTGGVENVEP